MFPRGLIPLLLCWSLLAGAQDLARSVQVFTRADGLTDDNITRVFRDSRGYIWICTENGLNRYDGRNIRRYDQVGEGGLTDLNIKCMAEDAEGRLWIGTEYGLNRLDPLTDRITRYYEGTGPGKIPYRWCNYLYVDNRKRLWLSTEKGIALYDSRQDSFRNHPVAVYGNNPRINKFISQIMEDGQGRLWLATSFGVKRFDPQSGSVVSYHFPVQGETIVPENSAYCLYRDPEGSLWAGTYGGGLLRYVPAEDRFVKIPAASPSIITGIITLFIGNEPKCILSSESGLYQVNSGAKDQYRLEPLAFGNTFFTGMMATSEREAWICSQQGLYRLRLNHPAFSWMPLVTATDLQAYHIIPVPGNASMVYAVSRKGWEEMNITNGSVGPRPVPGSTNPVVSNVNKWVADRAGYWITSLNGFGHFDPASGAFRDLTQLVKERSGQLSTGFIVQDDAGKLWVTMRRSGILVYDPQTGVAENFLADTTLRDNIYLQQVSDMQKGPDGIIYFTCGRKLYRVDPRSREYRVYREPEGPAEVSGDKIAPRQLYFAPGNRLFVSSLLRIYEWKDERLQVRYPKKGFAPFRIEQFRGNPRGEIWMLTSNGITRTDTSFRQLYNLGSLVPLHNGDITEITPAEEGGLFLTGFGGIGRIRDSLLRPAQAAPAPVLSRVKAGSRTIYFPGNDQAALRMSYTDALEIELSCPACIGEPSGRTWYRLSGLDEEWKELASGTLVRYEQLAPGRYRFEARTTGHDQTPGPVVSFPVRVMPPLYLRWWFILSASAILLLVIYFFYRYRLRRALELEKLRTRIATDLHDDIGATLSSISMYSDAVKRQVRELLPHLEPVLDKMGENSREMVTSMSDIVWAINPANDSGEKLALRMEAHARDLCAVKEVHLQFSAGRELGDLKLPLEHRKNIYLVFKEALNNALKYASAGNIRITLSLEKDRLQLEVADDGIGFDPQRNPGGNGLKNMRQRAEEIGGQLQVSSSGNGTRVQLQCRV